MNQWHEDFLARLLDLPDRVLHLRVAARVAFLLDPLEEPLGRMPLFFRNATVLFQDLSEATKPAERAARRKGEGGRPSPNGPIFGLLKGTSRR